MPYCINNSMYERQFKVKLCGDNLHAIANYQDKHCVARCIIVYTTISFYLKFICNLSKQSTFSDFIIYCDIINLLKQQMLIHVHPRYHIQITYDILLITFLWSCPSFTYNSICLFLYPSFISKFLNVLLADGSDIKKKCFIFNFCFL